MVRQDLGLAELLWEVCEFDLSPGNHGESVRLSSGHALEGRAGDFTRGTFFLCAEHRSIRPVLYASSEGQAGLIGHGLAEALEVLVGLPSWRDCLKFFRRRGSGDHAAERQDQVRDGVLIPF
jgi:hypothetical protein